MLELPRYILKRPGFPPLWTKEELFFTGDEFYADILNEMSQAQKIITIEMYIWEDDETGHKFFESVKAAATKGIKIFILVDAIGSFRFIKKLHSLDYSENIKIKIFHPHPLSHGLHHHLLDQMETYLNMLRQMLRINRRNHRKIITIDEKICYTGSFNISNSHSDEHSKDGSWHDIGVKIQGWASQLLALSLFKNWSLVLYFKYKKNLPRQRFVKLKHPDLRINQDYYLKRFLYKDFLKRIKRSKKRVWLLTGYFSPKRRIIRNLKKAALRGVDVRILLSKKSDVLYYSLLQSYYHYELIKSGVKIFEYDPSIIHAKNTIIDQWITVGSTNLNYRSFVHDLEIDLVIQHPDNKKKCDENFQKLIIESKQITLETLAQRPWWVQILARVIFLARYWN